MENIAFKLKTKLLESVQRNKTDGLLFSGGVDTSILAAILVNLGSEVKAITVSLEAFGKDSRYAALVTKDLKLNHYHKVVDIDEAIDAIPMVIKTLKSFDPAIPNDLVVYFGLKAAKEMGIHRIMTGDGADELFAGYNFMKNMKDLDKYIKRISSFMLFSSNELGNSLGIDIKQPYINRELIDFALSIPKEFKIKREKGKIRGKWVLRKAFEDMLPKEIIWQSKRPLEYGSGMNRLRKIITSRVSDEEFMKKARLYQKRFINKEHLYYYEIYRGLFGEVPKPKGAQKACLGCAAGMKEEAFHCRVCGWVEPVK